MSEKPITRVSDKEVRKRMGQTDWERVRAMTDVAVEAAAESDPDARITDAEFWRSARLIVPTGPKKQITLRLDADLVAWFRAEGGRYQTRINAVLRAYMEAMKRD